MVESPGSPTQDQLFAYYTHRCGCHRVRKANTAVLRLLEECVPSPIKTGVDAPLASRRVFKLESTDGGPVHVGSRGMLPLLELVAVLPRLEELDLSNLTSWYAADAFVHKSGVSGNDIVEQLCRTMLALPRLQRVSLLGQPIGSHAAYKLLTAVQKAPHITVMDFDHDDVDPLLLAEIQRTLTQRSRQMAAGLASPSPPLPLAEVPDCVSRLPRVDRKTLREQQLLRLVLEEEAASFRSVLAEETMSELVLCASVMTVSEVIARCPDGVRGDGHHLFIIKSGAINAYVDRLGLTLRRGDYFGDTYADVLFPRCDLSLEEEGTVYCLPLTACGTLRADWESRVSAYIPVLRSSPFFQAVDLWSRVRACTCAVRVEAAVGHVVVRAQDPTRQLLVVCHGTFLAMPGEERARIVTGRFTPFSFTDGDVFGMEPLVSVYARSSVSVVGGSTVSGRGGSVTNVCLRITGCAVRCLVAKTRSLLFALARPFSTHDDLYLSAKWRAEADPVAEYMYVI